MQKQDIQSLFAKELKKIFSKNTMQFPFFFEKQREQNKNDFPQKNYNNNEGLFLKNIDKIKELNKETAIFNRLLSNDLKKNVETASHQLASFSLKGQGQIKGLEKSIKTILSLFAKNIFSLDNKIYDDGEKNHISDIMGSVFSALNVTPFARGGIIDKPVLTPMALMGEAGPEAVIPLSRTSDGKLGVSSSKTISSFNVSISTYTKNSIDVSTQEDSKGNLHIILEEIDKGIASKLSAGKSHIGNTIKDVYHLKRRGQ